MSGWSDSAIAISGDLFLLRFAVPLLGIGLALAYITLGKVINRTEIYVQETQLTARYKPLRWHGNIAVPVGEIERVTVEDYEVGDGWTFTHYRLVAITQEGQKIKLVPDIDRFDAADFMEQKIVSHLGFGQPLSAAEEGGEGDV